MINEDTISAIILFKIISKLFKIKILSNTEDITGLDITRKENFT